MNEQYLKVLDGSRKGVLKLPSGAVRLWLAYYMSESEGQESFLSLRGLVKLTGMDKKTVIKWKQFLLGEGWIVPTGATAAQRYSKPTKGSHKVLTMRVDDPLKEAASLSRPGGVPVENIVSVEFNALPSHSEQGCSNLATELQQSCSEDGQLKATSGIIPLGKDVDGGSIPLAEGQFIGGIIPPKVSSSVSVSASGSNSFTHSIYSGMNEMKDGTTSQSPTGIKATPKTKPTAKTKTPGSPSSATLKQKHNAKYDTPFPSDFNSWTTLDRSVWCEEHKVKAVEAIVEDEVKALMDSAPFREQPVSGTVQVPVPTPVEEPVPTEEEPAPVEVEATDEPVEDEPPYTPPPPALDLKEGKMLEAMADWKKRMDEKKAKEDAHAAAVRRLTEERWAEAERKELENRAREDEQRNKKRMAAAAGR